MLRVICMALMNAVPTAATVFGAAYATSDDYGIGFSTTMYLWISVSGNLVAVILIPFVGNLSDKIGRRPCIIVGALGSTALSYAYLWAISQANASWPSCSRSSCGASSTRATTRSSRPSTRSSSPRRPG
jgi:MFS family permease